MKIKRTRTDFYHKHYWHVRKSQFSRMHAKFLSKWEISASLTTLADSKVYDCTEKRFYVDLFIFLEFIFKSICNLRWVLVLALLGCRYFASKMDLTFSYFSRNVFLPGIRKLVKRLSWNDLIGKRKWAKTLQMYPVQQKVQCLRIILL